MKHDEFGDRMKGYENEFRAFVGDKVGLPLYPYMRLDGRSFSNFTKKLASRGLIYKPRDVNFEDVFVRTCKDLVSEFSLKLAFHQSDEISIFFAPVVDPASQMLFDGNIQKLASVVPSYFTARFCYHFHQRYGEVPEVSFDGRVCAFRDDVEATNMLVWRFQDAKRNLIQDIAHRKFGDKFLFKKSTAEKFEMIGSPELKPGNFIKRVKYTIPVDTHGMVNVATEVVRSRSSAVSVDFQNMTFEERRELVYGEYREI